MRVYEFVLQNPKHTSATPSQYLASSLIQHLTQPLHRAQQQVALPHDGVVLRLLHGWPVRLDDAVHLVDRAVEAAGGDEAGELAGSEGPLSNCVSKGT